MYQAAPMGLVWAQVLTAGLERPLMCQGSAVVAFRRLAPLQTSRATADPSKHHSTHTAAGGSYKWIAHHLRWRCFSEATEGGIDVYAFRRVQ